MALIGPVKRNGGGSGKRIKRDTVQLCRFLCARVCARVRLKKGAFLQPTKFSLSRQISPHPRVCLIPPLPSVSLFLCFHPAPRPSCEIHHVFTLHYPQCSFLTKRGDESQRRPSSPCTRSGDGRQRRSGFVTL